MTIIYAQQVISSLNAEDTVYRSIQYRTQWILGPPDKLSAKIDASAGDHITCEISPEPVQATKVIVYSISPYDLNVGTVSRNWAVDISTDGQTWKTIYEAFTPWTGIAPFASKEDHISVADKISYVRIRQGKSGVRMGFDAIGIEFTPRRFPWMMAAAVTVGIVALVAVVKKKK